ncbi:hypothetical protein EPN28_02820 [Patescibacteria group bacterium]|nr:MAG: hypothetical protein EPN28_02820 [Patescibacteria group bacterium]
MRVLAEENFEKEVKENFLFQFFVPKAGVYFIEISASAKSWWQNLLKFRSFFRDDDLALKIDESGFDKLSGKRGIFDGEAAWNGNKLKSLEQTIVFLLPLGAGAHKIQFFSDQRPVLKKIIVYESGRNILYSPSPASPRDGNRRPWLTFAFKDLVIKNLKVKAKADADKDDSDIKLVINGQVEKNEESKSHHGWYWCGRVLKGKAKIFDKSFNRSEGSARFIEFWTDGMPLLEEIKMRVTEKGVEKTGRVVVRKDIVGSGLSEVNLRAAADENGDITGKIKTGEEVLIDEIAVSGSNVAGMLSNNWHGVYYNGMSGYVHSSLIELAGQERKRITDFIQTKAGELGIDKNLALNLAYCESKWLPFAISETGNKGIFELGGDTIIEINGKLGGNIRDPYDPWQNIDGGLKYLRFLLERYKDTENSLEKSITAWSRGPDRVPYNKPFVYAEQSRGAQALLDGVLKSKAGENILKALGALVVFLILGFGAIAFASSGDNARERLWYLKLERGVELGLEHAAWLVDIGEVDLADFEDDFDLDGEFEKVQFFVFPSNVDDGYFTRVFLSATEYFDVDGIFIEGKGLDLNGGGEKELFVRTVKDDIFNLYIFSLRDKKLRLFPVYDNEITRENVKSIKSKFRIENTRTGDGDGNEAVAFIAKRANYKGEYCDWYNTLEYYEWNGVGFEKSRTEAEPLFPEGHCAAPSSRPELYGPAPTIQWSVN